MDHSRATLLIFLQVFGGGCYLLQRVFLAIRERAVERREKLAARLRIAAWAVYCLGLPPIVLMLGMKHDWIAASVELGGAPSMALGLVLAIKRSNDKPPKWLDWLALGCIVLGLGYSLYDFGGLNQLNQWLEIGLVVGFLIGTYQLALDRMQGYLWYVLMHVSCGWLTWNQNMPWFAAQQAVSLIFILDAYNTRLRKRRQTAASVASA